MKGDKVLSDKEEKIAQLGIKSLFEKPNVRIISIVLFINWVLINLGYYGISMSSGNLSDNIFANYFLISLIGKYLTNYKDNIHEVQIDFYRNSFLYFPHFDNGPFGKKVSVCFHYVAWWNFHNWMCICGRRRAENWSSSCRSDI